MAGYDQYGAGDDRIAEEAERGFLGFNDRLRPDQLQSGLLQISENGRLDLNGQWQVRKGVQNRLAPFGISGTALRLPTQEQIDAGEVSLLPHTISAATHSAGVVTLTTYNEETGAVDDHHLSVGDTIQVNNILSDDSNPDIVNGTFTIASVPTGSTLTYAVSGSSTLTVSEGANLGITTSTGPQFTPQDFTTGTPPKFLPCGGAIILNDNAVSEVTCGCKFSDPNTTSEQEYILLASNSKVVAYNTTSQETFDIPLLSGETIPVESDIEQVFNKIIIFRQGQISLENDRFFKPLEISAANLSGTTLVTITTFANHRLETGDFIDISGLSGTVNANGQFEITKTGDKTFTYSVAVGGSDEDYVVTGAFVNPTFNLVANGNYTQPAQISSSITTAAGLCTVTATANHNLKTGNMVIVDDKANSNLENGEEYQVTVTSDTEFTIFVQHADETNTQNVIFERRVSVGLGFTHSPAPAFGTYHNKRLAVPYRYDVSGTSGNAQITERDIKDEILISDLLDSDTYDIIFGQFRMNAGTADFVVGLQSFSNDQLVVFNRNSIHTISNTITLSSAPVRQITDEVGCLARRSIQQIGSEILFLSDNGVYGISFLDEYNLRGTALPLSEPINKTILRINKEYATRAVAAYYDNRYYLAVPLDDNNTNSHIIVYNFLNKQWESVDFINDSDFDILDLIVAGKGTDRAVYAINSLGGIHQLDVNESGQDAIITEIGDSSAEGINILGKARTRQFTQNDIDRKKWRDFEIQCESGSVPTDFTIKGNTENIDQENIGLGTLRSLNGGSNLEANESVSIRGRIGNKRAYGFDIQIDNTVGRPKLRAIEVSGAITFNSDYKAK